MTEAQTIPANADVSLREITADTVYSIIKFSETLPDDQQKMVALNAVSIAQAHFSDKAWFRAIYANETPVGFVMLYDNSDKSEYFLWRLMIAGPHQKKGFGERAIALLVDYVKTRPNVTFLGASYVPMDGGPEGFYKKLGFEPTGEVEHEEIVVRLSLI